MNTEELSKNFISRNEAPLDKRTLYQTVEEFLSAPENAYEEIFVPHPSPGHTQIVSHRFIGQKVMIRNPLNSDSPSEYWFKDGIADADLVRYTPEFNDSYEWELIEPSGGNGGSGGGTSLNGDPMRLVKGNGSLTAGFMEVRHALDGVFSNIPALPYCDGYIITMSADKLYATIHASSGCSPSFKVIRVSRNDVSSNFNAYWNGWASFVSSANA